jgi:hypothetical protein
VYKPSKNVIIYAAILLLSNAITAVSVSTQHDIKYADPDNENNYIIFTPDTQNSNRGSFDLVQENGDSFGGTYTKSPKSYNLDFPHGNRLEIKGNTLEMPGNNWIKV